MTRHIRMLLIRDRRPGHFQQAEALAEMIAGATPVRIARIELKPTIFGHGEVREGLRRILPLTSAAALRLFFRIDLAPIGTPDIILASGRAAGVAAALIRRKTGAAFVQSGYAGNLRDHEYDLMLVQAPSCADGSRRVLTPIPTLVDERDLPRAKPLRSRGDLEGATVSLFVGGDTKGYRYSRAEWQRLAGFVEGSTHALGLRWAVTTSPRTSTDAAALFAALAASSENILFTDFAAAGPGSSKALYANDVMVVTQDSRSMIAESLASMRPVMVLRPSNVVESQATEEVAAMATAGALARFRIEDLAPDKFVAAILAAEPARQPPRDRVAAVIEPLLDKIRARLADSGD